MDNNRGKKRNCSSKKINCPALIFVSHIIKFPQFQISSELKEKLPSESLKKSTKKKMVIKLKSDNSDIIKENLYYISLPDSTEHKGHPFVTPMARDVDSSKMFVSNVSTLDKRKVNKNRDKARRTREPIDPRVFVKLNSLIAMDGSQSVSMIKSELNR